MLGSSCEGVNGGGVLEQRILMFNDTLIFLIKQPVFYTPKQLYCHIYQCLGETSNDINDLKNV